MKNLAPIALFTYNRINTLEECINSLKKNDLAKQSTLYIFSDGPKDISQKKNVEKVRIFVKKIKGFKKKIVIIKKKNIGLAKNIIYGVSKILKKNNNIIVLEDDILVTKNFLRFMNSALNNYEKNKKVWHISGWNYNISCNSKFDAYFTRGMNCWGWATWNNRWKYFQKNPEKIINEWTNKDILKFNFNGSYNFFSQIERTLSNEPNTWAVFWYAKIFQNNGLCLNPKKTLTKNIGIGKFSTNTKSVDNIFKSSYCDENFLPKKLPIKLIENKRFLAAIRKKFLSKNKIKYYISKIFS